MSARWAPPTCAVTVPAMSPVSTACAGGAAATPRTSAQAEGTWWSPTRERAWPATPTVRSVHCPSSHLSPLARGLCVPQVLQFSMVTSPPLRRGAQSFGGGCGRGRQGPRSRARWAQRGSRQPGGHELVGASVRPLSAPGTSVLPRSCPAGREAGGDRSRSVPEDLEDLRNPPKRRPCSDFSSAADRESARPHARGRPDSARSGHARHRTRRRTHSPKPGRSLCPRGLLLDRGQDRRPIGAAACSL